MYTYVYIGSWLISACWQMSVLEDLLRRAVRERDQLGSQLEEALEQVLSPTNCSLCTPHPTHYTLHTTHYTRHTTHYTHYGTSLDLSLESRSNRFRTPPTALSAPPNPSHYTLHTAHYTLHTTHYIPHTTHCTHYGTSLDLSLRRRSNRFRTPPTALSAPYTQCA